MLGVCFFLLFLLLVMYQLYQFIPGIDTRPWKYVVYSSCFSVQLTLFFLFSRGSCMPRGMRYTEGKGEVLHMWGRAKVLIC